MQVFSASCIISGVMIASTGYFLLSSHNIIELPEFLQLCSVCDLYIYYSVKVYVTDLTCKLTSNCLYIYVFVACVFLWIKLCFLVITTLVAIFIKERPTNGKDDSKSTSEDTNADMWKVYAQMMQVTWLPNVRELLTVLFTWKVNPIAVCLNKLTELCDLLCVDRWDFRARIRPCI